jgi:hypothetical protein
MVIKKTSGDFARDAGALVRRAVVCGAATDSEAAPTTVARQ